MITAMTEEPKTPAQAGASIQRAERARVAARERTKSLNALRREAEAREVASMRGEQGRLRQEFYERQVARQVA